MKYTPTATNMETSRKCEKKLQANRTWQCGTKKHTYTHTKYFSKKVFKLTNLFNK